MFEHQWFKPKAVIRSDETASILAGFRRVLRGVADGALGLKTIFEYVKSRLFVFGVWIPLVFFLLSVDMDITWGKRHGPSNGGFSASFVGFVEGIGIYLPQIIGSTLAFMGTYRNFGGYGENHQQFRDFTSLLHGIQPITYHDKANQKPKDLHKSSAGHVHR